MRHLISSLHLVIIIFVLLSELEAHKLVYAPRNSLKQQENKMMSDATVTKTETVTRVRTRTQPVVTKTLTATRYNEKCRQTTWTVFATKLSQLTRTRTHEMLVDVTSTRTRTKYVDEYATVVHLETHRITRRRRTRTVTRPAATTRTRYFPHPGRETTRTETVYVKQTASKQSSSTLIVVVSTTNVLKITEFRPRTLVESLVSVSVFVDELAETTTVEFTNTLLETSFDTASTQTLDEINYTTTVTLTVTGRFLNNFFSKKESVYLLFNDQVHEFVI